MGVCEIIMLNICTGEKILEVENMFCVVNEHLQAWILPEGRRSGRDYIC